MARKLLLIFLVLVSVYHTKAQLPPTISSFSPSSGLVGSLVTITGANFDNTPSNNLVFFGNVSATVNTATSTTLTVTVPVGASYNFISVLNKVNNLVARSLSYFTPVFSPSKSTILNTDYTSTGTDFTTNANPNSVVLADIDGDGKLDMVVANSGSSNVSIFKNTGTVGTLSFASKIDITTGATPLSVFAADIDGDGLIDIITANSTGNSVSILRNTSTSTSISFDAKIDITTAAGATSITAGDFDNDGKIDIATANKTSNSVSVFKNTSTLGSISFATKQDFTTGTNPNSIAVGDIDGDGKIEIAVANKISLGSGSISVFKNTSSAGSISFAAKQDFTAGSDAASIAMGDLDGDGKLDIITQNWNPGTASTFRNTSNSTTISFVRLDVNVFGSGYCLVLADTNGDGKVDGVATHTTTSIIGNLQNNSTVGAIAMAGTAGFATGSNPQGLAVADVDGDGLPDFVCANNGASSIRIYRSIAAKTPGNSLNFNGNNNFITTNISQRQSSVPNVTWEAWIKPTRVNFGLRQQIISTDVAGYIRSVGIEANTNQYMVYCNGDLWLTNIPVDLNVYQHIAVVYDGSNNIYFYKNGALAATRGIAQGADNIANNITIGGNANYGTYSEYFQGDIDEVRIWNVARTASQIQANCLAPINTATTGLVAYYNFDKGTAGGTNTSITTLDDKTTNGNNGNLNNFTLTGTGSNWVESYAMVVPVNLSTSNITTSGFTANWSAPEVGVVTNYLLDVATDTLFANMVNGYSGLSVPSTSTSQAITGLASGTKYFFRIRADKTSVTGTGAIFYSNAVTTLLALPVITKQPVGNSICAAASTKFFVAATSSLALSYQWQVNTGSGFTNITNGGIYSGATSDTLFLTNVTATQNGYSYRCVVSNSAGSANSTAATLTVFALPTVTPITGATSVCQASTITLSNSTIGGAWSSSNASIATINNAGLVTGIAAGATTINYVVTNANNCFVTNTFSITVLAQPARTPIVKDTLICKATNYIVDATIPSSATYAWTASSGGFTSTLAKVSITNPALYRVRITLANGCYYLDSINLRNTADTAIKAKLSVTGQGFLNDNIVAVNLTNPTPQNVFWNIPSGAQVVSQSTANIILKFANTGKYQVGLNATSYNVCSSTDSSIIIISNKDTAVNSTTSVIVREVNVGPNPSSSGLFNFNIKLNKASKVSLRIYSTNGLLVYSAIIPESTGVTSISKLADISSSPKNTYMAIVQTADSYEVRTLIKN